VCIFYDVTSGHFGSLFVNYGIRNFMFESPTNTICFKTNSSEGVIVEGEQKTNSRSGTVIKRSLVEIFKQNSYVFGVVSSTNSA